MIVFIIRPNQDAKEHVICTARDREDAKNKAWGVFHGNRDHYIVTPLTQKGDLVVFDLITTAR